MKHCKIMTNNNGVPELFIGADCGDSDNPSVFVTGVYGLQDGKTVSLIQTGSYGQLLFLEGINGNRVFERVYGPHMEYAVEGFYTLDNDDKLETLDILYTYIEAYGNTYYENTYRHTKEADGKEQNITKHEYSALLEKYGSYTVVDSYGSHSKSVVHQVEINNWKSIQENPYVDQAQTVNPEIIVAQPTTSPIEEYSPYGVWQIVDSVLAAQQVTDDEVEFYPKEPISNNKQVIIDESTLKIQGGQYGDSYNNEEFRIFVYTIMDTDGNR